MNRRDFLIKSIGSAIVAGMTPPLLGELLPKGVAFPTMAQIAEREPIWSQEARMLNGRIVSALGRPITPEIINHGFDRVKKGIGYI